MGRLSHSRYSEGNQIHAMHVGNKKRMIKLRVQDKRPHVVVLGAGIIGLSSAYVLANTPGMFMGFGFARWYFVVLSSDLCSLFRFTNKVKKRQQISTW